MKPIILLILIFSFLAFSCGGAPPPPPSKKDVTKKDVAKDTKTDPAKKDATKKEETEVPAKPKQPVIDSESLARFAPKLPEAFANEAEWVRYSDTIEGNVSWGLYKLKTDPKDQTKPKALIQVDITDMRNRMDVAKEFTKKYKEYPAKIEENEYLNIWVGKFMIRVSGPGNDVREEEKPKFKKQELLEEIITSIELDKLSKL